MPVHECVEFHTFKLFLDDSVKSNCIAYAWRQFFKRASPGEESYLIFRRSRIPWGFFHALHGELDHETNQIVVTSYKPPDNHEKTGFAPTFHGKVVAGDRPAKKPPYEM